MNIRKLFHKFKVEQRSLTNSDKGASIIETLVALSLISVLFVHVLYSGMLSLVTTTRAQRTAVATQIAAETLEDFFSINPDSLTSAMNDEVDIEVDNVDYQVMTTVTINSDRSRQVDVQVSTVHTGGEISVSLSNSFALWGNR